ncbi:MAG: selenate reductase [Tissierellia bacterium]|nr:selenate reductase [Tissierellia bacterium]
MSDIMKPMPFRQMIERALQEYKDKGKIWNVSKIMKVDHDKKMNIFGETLENPLGIAAGPNTQLAHNILAAYAGGARFMELKTVQIMYGEELGIPKPCIRAEDEAYNVEWSSEFRADMARDEYIKAWFGCKVLAKELGFGDPNGFIFNMSVGYNLEGIKSPLVNEFIDTLMDASGTEQFKECKEILKDMVGEFEHVDEAFIDSITPNVCRSMTLSTMHGCPPEEIEAIGTYLLKEKNINTYIKCNPTLLGYDYVRDILDKMGYDYITFGHPQFDNDLNMEAAVPMIHRLMDLAKELDLSFGVKLTNTFQVSIKNNELPGQDMYMSGKALYPLSISVARMLSKEFDGKLPMSFSGGADKNNIAEIFNAGIWPITVATIVLKPTGLDNTYALADILAKEEYPTHRDTNTEKLEALVEDVVTNKNYVKSAGARKKYDKHKHYDCVHSDTYTCRVLCQNCVRVCPNRTNEVLELKDTKIILHVDSICNECGNCQFFCVEPCIPYQDRITLFDGEEMLKDSKNEGFAVDGENFVFRWEGEVGTGDYDELPAPLKEVYDAIKVQHPYLI